MNAWIKNNLTLPAIISLLLILVSAVGAFFSMKGDLSMAAARAEAAHARVGKVEAALEKSTDRILQKMDQLEDRLYDRLTK